MEKEVTLAEVLALATPGNPVINKTGNKIDFADGTTYAKDFFTKKYHKVKSTIL